MISAKLQQMIEPRAAEVRHALIHAPSLPDDSFPCLIRFNGTAADDWTDQTSALVNLRMARVLSSLGLIAEHQGGRKRRQHRG